jgi:hypothetical protein
MLHLVKKAAIVATLAALGSMAPVQAAQKCELNGKFDFGKYWLENNQWNRNSVSNLGNSWQCVWYNKYNSRTDCEFGWQWNWVKDNGQIKAYPYVGTWKNGLPVQLSANKNILLDWKFWVSTAGRFNCSWDIWISGSTSDTAPATAEIMIWTYRNGDYVTPSGTYQTTVNLAGANWEVWKGRESSGNQSWDYLAFVRTTNQTWTENMNLKEFTDYLRNRGWLNSSHYIHQIHAGSELFEGEGWLHTYGFRADVQ